MRRLNFDQTSGGMDGGVSGDAGDNQRDSKMNFFFLRITALARGELGGIEGQLHRHWVCRVDRRVGALDEHSVWGNQ